MVKIAILLFVVLFPLFAFAHDLVGVEVRPGKKPNTAQVFALSVFEAGERVARMEVHASVMYLENGRDIYKPIAGIDESNDINGSWFYNTLFLGSPETFTERTTVRNEINIPLSGLNLEGGRDFIIRFDFGTHTDITKPLNWREAAAGFLTITGDGLRLYRPAQYFNSEGRPLYEKQATLADLLDGPEQAGATFIDPWKVETAFHKAPRYREPMTPERQNLDNQRRALSLLARGTSPLLKLRQPNQELIYFATNRPLIAYPDRSKPWGTFAAREKDYEPTEKMRTGAVMVEFDATRAPGALDGSRITHLFGNYEDAPSTDEERAAADNFMRYIWGQDILIYVHGFNVSFEAAMIQAAQLKRDLDYPGPVIAVSWASLGNATAYFEDEKTVRKSIEVISSMLEYFIDGNLDPKNALDCPPGKINVIAHSMGNWVFLNSVGVLNLKRRFFEHSFHNVILASPDVDKSSLLNLGPVIAKGSHRVTLYYSGKDVPLWLSLAAHKGNKRAGTESYDITGIDLVDVNNVNEAWIRLGHSAYAASEKVLQDIRLQLSHDLSPKHRTPLLKQKVREFNLLAPEYSDWEFAKPTP